MLTYSTSRLTFGTSRAARLALGTLLTAADVKQISYLRYLNLALDYELYKLTLTDVKHSMLS